MKMKKENLMIIILLALSIGFASGYSMSMYHNQQFDKMIQNMAVNSTIKPSN